MNLVIDLGNSQVKAGLFNHRQLIAKEQFTDEASFFDFLSGNETDACIVCSVKKDSEAVLDRIRSKTIPILLTAKTALPVIIDYATPHTLGVDRIAAACGSLELLPDQPRFVIDTGTCINYEFVDGENVYHGGAISPGVRMRLEAMNKFTARLPLVDIDGPAPITGNSTETCMRAGVIHGVAFEMEGFINAYKRLYPGLGVILCGGDTLMFEKQLKHAIFVAPDLVLTGLNRILLHNASL